jgi:hypothetical protein
MLDLPCEIRLARGRGVNPRFRLNGRGAWRHAMKVAIIFATDGSSCEDAVVAPFRAAGFVAGLGSAGVEPVMIEVEPDHVPADPAAPVEPPARRLRTGRDALGTLLADERPDVIQTFGPEQRLAAIWALAADNEAPLVHCVSCWRADMSGADTSPAASLEGSCAKGASARASARVAALVGTSRAAVGCLMEIGYFPCASSSIIVPPPVERGAADATSEAARTAEAVFGVYDPCASADLVAFLAHTIELTGRRHAMQMRIAMRHPPPGDGVSIARVAPEGIEHFIAGIDVLAVPTYDDSVAAVLIAALRSGKSVIVPDPSGAAELIEYGRHGLTFAAGSAYHFANAMNLVGQSWRQKPVLLAHGRSAIAGTDPAAVARRLAAGYRQLLAAPGAARAVRPSHG